MRKQILIAALLAVLMASATGCNKFLDIQPRGTMPKEVLFRDEQGFKDALYGIYASMGSRSLYGENLTYGFLDKMGQMFMYNNTENPDTYILQYDYLHGSVRPTIDQIWTDQYQVISYVNELIDAYETTPLSSSTLDMIGGEAYGLRAFLHFDILRLFCSDYLQKGSGESIPYAFKADLKNKEIFSIEDSYKNILADLDKAEELLKDDNSLYLPMGTSSDSYMDERYAHLNKYAVKALKARVYYTMGRLQEAASYAEEVIKATGASDNAPEGVPTLKLTEKGQFEKARRFPAPGELIFGLYAPRVAQNVYDMFLQNTASGSFTEARTDLKSLYETDKFTASSIDHRYSLFYKELTGGIYAFTRLMTNETELRTNAFEGITLIRLPEMYYILSECLYSTDRSRSISLLNAVRNSRGLADLDPAKVSTQEKFIEELMRERMREMPGEGQIFLAYKHYNLPILDRRGKNTLGPSSEIFVLPRPEKEKEFGIVSSNNPKN